MTTESEANGGGSAFEGWGVLELFGHRRLGGYVSEQELAGQAFVRIDVPDRRGPAEKVLATQLYHPNAVYALTPCGESEARAVAYRNEPEPVTRWELPRPSARRDYEGYPAGAEDVEEYDLRADVDEDDEEHDGDHEHLLCGLMAKVQL